MMDICMKLNESLEPKDDHLNIPLGDTFPIEFENPDGIDEDYTFESDNPDVASVDEEGNEVYVNEELQLEFLNKDNISAFLEYVQQNQQ